MRYRAHAVTETPVAISLRRATGNDLDTQRFIPGTVLRGALAGVYLEERGLDVGFEALFLRRLVRYGDLRIADTRPWPYSTRQCSADPDRHPKSDNLLREAAGETCRRECAKCRSKLEIPHGYYRYRQPAESLPLQRATQTVRCHRLAHSQVDPAFLRAKPGQFHSSQLMDSGQIFEGFVHSKDAGEEALLKLIGDGRRLYVGRGRSRGQGRIRLSIYPEAGRTAERIGEKIRQMNEAARRFDQLRDSVLFSCTLDSAALVYDRWLCSRSFLDADDLSPDLNGYSGQACFQGRVDLAGWHSTAGLPKAETVAIAAGSCFLFRRNGVRDRDAEYARLAAIFADVEERGIGERLEEGLGEVTFSRTLHSELAGEA